MDVSNYFPHELPFPVVVGPIMYHPPLISSVYLAGPLENCTREEASDWRKETERQLRQNGRIFSFIPGHDTTLNDSHTITLVDFAMIDKAEAVLANLSYLGSPTIGTGTLVELGYAKKAGKIIVGFTTKEWTAENRFLRGVLDMLFTTQQEAIDYLVGFNIRKSTLKAKL